MVTELKLRLLGTDFLLRSAASKGLSGDRWFSDDFVLEAEWDGSLWSLTIRCGILEGIGWSKECAQAAAEDLDAKLHRPRWWLNGAQEQRVLDLERDLSRAQEYQRSGWDWVDQLEAANLTFKDSSGKEWALFAWEIGSGDAFRMATRDDISALERVNSDDADILDAWSDERIDAELRSAGVDPNDVARWGSELVKRLENQRNGNRPDDTTTRNREPRNDGPDRDSSRAEGPAGCSAEGAEEPRTEPHDHEARGSSPLGGRGDDEGVRVGCPMCGGTLVVSGYDLKHIAERLPHSGGLPVTFITKSRVDFRCTRCGASVCCDRTGPELTESQESHVSSAMGSELTTRPNWCGSCSGDGYTESHEGAITHTCRDCNGSGMVKPRKS